MTIIFFVHVLGLWLDSISLANGVVPLLALVACMLMPGLPIALFWFLDSHRSSRDMKRIQQLLRANAGPDELLIRQLQDNREQEKHGKSPDD